MLVRAVSSIALERRLFGSTAAMGQGDDGGSFAASGGGDGGGGGGALGSEKGGEDSSVSPGSSTPPPPAGERVLTEWLEGRVSEVSKLTKSYHAVTVYSTEK